MAGLPPSRPTWRQNELAWDQVQRVAVAIPGPRRSYGVLERGPNLPESFVGFDVQTTYSPLWPSVPGVPCRCPSATTATWAAWPRRSGSAAAAAAPC